MTGTITTTTTITTGVAIQMMISTLIIISINLARLMAGTNVAGSSVEVTQTRTMSGNGGAGE